MIIKRLLGLFLLLTSVVSAADNLQDRLAKAKAGQTVTLPAGEFRGGVTIPPAVSLKGAGVGKTIVTGGLTISGGRGAQVSDLTLRGAGVVVKDAETVTIARVRATGGTSGFMFSGVQKGRIENCVSDRNGFGISVSGGADCVVVNCTVTACPEVGLSIAKCPNAIAFNNCIVGSATCLNIDVPEGKRIDHNLYSGLFIGQMKEQTAKRILTAWQYLTGVDAHSVQMPVEFNEDFTPQTMLTWAPDRAATAEWGAPEFAGVKAPTTDMFGNRRTGRPDLGAVKTLVTDIKTTRIADGQFTVAGDVGLKSAGVFTKSGVLISYLFQNLPLPKGTYSFWLPARDYVGQPIPAGEYEVRLAESDFRWQYQNHIADNGEDRGSSYSASFNPMFVAFSPKGLLIMQEDTSEDHTGIRAYDPLTGKLKWYIPGGSDAQGIAIGKDGTIYSVMEINRDQGVSRLTRFDGTTGRVIPWPGSKVGHVPITTCRLARSLALFGDRLYLAGAAANKLYVISTTEGKVEKTVDVPAPRSVAADEKTGVLWVVSGTAVIAIQPDGTKVAESSVVPEPAAVAARDGQLAVASTKTGKVHFFDARDPKNLKPVREFGKGDGPFGAFAPDRFWFQRGGHWQSSDQLNASLALGPAGQFAVVDKRRTLMFDGSGKNLWYTIGVFGNYSKPSFATQSRRFWDTQGDLSFWLNEKDGTWQPEALWDHSALTPQGLLEHTVQSLGDFADGKQAFFVAISPSCGVPFGPPQGQCDVPVLVVGRIEGFKTLPVLNVLIEGGKAVMREDTNGDGRITKDDTGQPLVDAAGKPLPWGLFNRFNDLQPDGSISTMGVMPMIWKRTGLNARGVPVYDAKNYVSRLAPDWRKALSPYDFKPDGESFFVVTGALSDGGFVVQSCWRGSGGTGMSNAGGTDLAGYGPDGKRRWVHPLAQYKGIGGMGTVDDITLTAVYYSCETIAVDADGLALGGFCEARQLYYGGYMIDHPNLRLFKMPDGKLHATVGSNGDGRHPWYRLDNQASLKKSKHSFRVADDRAKELAALERKPTPPPAAMAQPQIRIPQLKQPLTIDGDLEKWRKAGVQPQIIIGPSGSFDGPGDCSAIIRMAYEGQNLYFQVLQFDDVPMFYQMVQQDAVELALNGAFGNGYQFVVFKDADGKDTVWRNRFFEGGAQRVIDPSHAPSIVKVLDNAEAVTERQALEGLYGVDLSKAKVVLTEFKIPIDAKTYAPKDGDVFPLAPGKSFWIGFFVDDNDNPYTDVQSLITWPATFGMFSPKEEGALAICE